jgi:glucose/arabinose dehydrogenase
VNVGSIKVDLQTVLTFDPSYPAQIAPSDLVPLNDGTGRFLLATLGGTIEVLSPDGMGGLQFNPQPLLTNSQTNNRFIEESGMTGIALHKDFNAPGAFGYGKLYTISAEPSFSGTPDFSYSGSVAHQDVVREWNIASVIGDPNTYSLPSIQISDSRELIRSDRPGNVHSMTDLAFDSKGYLNITSGDGASRPPQGITLDAQNLSNILGTLLRINPDPNAHAVQRTSANTGQPSYSVPDDNFYNGDDATEDTSANTLAEIYAYGLRSPYRLGIDRGGSQGVGQDNMYLGDVGQNAREEVSRITDGNSSAANFGWPYFEGTRDGPRIAELPPDLPLEDPLFEYMQSVGRTVVGGTVYRGPTLTGLQGKYVFAEFGQETSTSPKTAQLFYGDPEGDGTFFHFDLSESSSFFEVVDQNGNPLPNQKLPDRIFSIAEDENGELYLLAGQDPRPGRPTAPSAYVIRVAIGSGILFGDLTEDGVIDPNDWTAFKNGQGTDFTFLTATEAYLKGDMDGDFDHDLEDFSIFKGVYIDANGLKAFQELGGVPESGTLTLLLAGTFLASARRNHRSNAANAVRLK